MYSIIHNVPWFRFERDEFGKVVIGEYFMKGQRGQWAGEGYIVSFLTSVTGIMLIVLSRAGIVFESTNSRRLFILIDIAFVFIMM